MILAMTFPTLLRVITLFAGLCSMTQASSAPAAPAAPAPRLVIIGASYAAGWGKPALPGYQVIANKGVGGEDSSQVAARFARDVVALKPDAVLIWGHINDIHRASPEQMAAVKLRARENYRAMHAQASAAGIDVLLATEITFSVGDGFFDGIMDRIARMRGRQNYRVVVNNHVKEVNAWLRQYAREQNLPLLDLERAVDSGNGSRREEYDDEDGSHVNPEGYAALTRYATQQLRGSTRG